MNFVSIVMVIFSILAALDRIFGSRLGLGKEFERGFHLLGNMTLSMAGMLIITPLLGELLKPMAEGFYQLVGIDPSGVTFATTWQAIADTWQDIEQGFSRNEGQFPGSEVG